MSIVYASIGLHVLLDASVKMDNIDDPEKLPSNPVIKSRQAMSRITHQLKKFLDIFNHYELKLKVSTIVVRSTIQYALWTTGPTSIRFCTVFQTTGNLGECFNDCNTILQIVTSFVELSTDLKASFPNKDDPTGGDLNYKDREDAIMKYFTYATYISINKLIKQQNLWKKKNRLQMIQLICKAM